MTWFPNMPFQGKLRFAILFTTAVAVLLACGAFLVFEYVGRQRALMRTISTLSRSIAGYSTASIAFNDMARAREALGALKAEPQVIAAVLCTKEGEVIATYRLDPAVPLPPLPEPKTGVRLDKDLIIGVEQVVEGSRWLGTLYIWASRDQLHDRMKVYAVLALVVLLATFFVSWVIATLLRNSIARPILELANTAGAIAAGSQDYSLRARQYGTDELGRLTAAFNAMLDRTQAAVADLRASETQLRVVTDNAPVFLMQVDRAHRFRFVNRPFAAQFGREPADLIGCAVAEVVGAKAAALLRPHMECALRGEQAGFESEFELPDATTLWIHAVFTPEPAADGSVSGFVGVVTDITQRRQIEQMVARARDEALAASRAKDDFLAALSHELRTPLNPVLLISSEAARDPALPLEAREDFETIRRHVELEARLIDDLLDLTAITRGKLSLDRRCLDLHAILRDAIATVSPEIEAKRIRLVLNIGAKQPRVYGDSVRLLQVFWNVLKNAVKFTPEGGRITVDTMAEGGRVSVRIADTGIGLTPVELGRIFDAFSQGDHAGEEGSHRFGGLGLGLAISRMVVELHEGRIVATSDGRGHGAVFLIELPLFSGPAEPVVNEPSIREPILTGPLVASTVAPRAESERYRRILLVEDHAATRLALERLLTRRNYFVRMAACVADARALAEDGKFDILISDVGLPDGNGYELMEEIGPRYALRGIALTGYGMEQDLARSRRAGFSAHLTKPIRAQELDAALARVIEEAEALDAPPGESSRPGFQGPAR